MNTKDVLLNHIIRKDLELKGDCYTLSDHIEYNPESIKIGANESVYIHLFSRLVPAPGTFYLNVLSPGQFLRFDESNTIEGISNQITRHLSTIKLSGNVPDGYQIHYVRVKHL